ncbi:MAG: hypothetical protein IK990_05925, partial [Ruminiclostridium sp.]|nr:hypothetical protein [Ruminiclostridium sp.]
GCEEESNAGQETSSRNRRPPLRADCANAIVFLKTPGCEEENNAGQIAALRNRSPPLRAVAKMCCL